MQAATFNTKTGGQSWTPIRGQDCAPVDTKFAHFKTKAVIRGLVEIGAIPRYTPSGKMRIQMPKGCGRTPADAVDDLSVEKQRRLIDVILTSSDDLDETLAFLQTSLAGWDKTRRMVCSLGDEGDILEYIASSTVDFFDKQSAAGKPGDASRGSGKVYAPAWFANYLARRGIWLFPLKFSTRLQDLYPSKWLPVTAWLAIPSGHRRLADAVLRERKSARSTSQAELLTVFLTSSLCSTMWQSSGFEAGALVLLKEYSLSGFGLGNFYSSSVNYVFHMASEYFATDIADIPEAPYFTGLRKVGVAGVDAFAWCFSPSPRNMKTVWEVTGTSGLEVPPYVRDWATQLREIMPAYNLKDVKVLVGILNTWLFYLMTLPAADAPRSMQDINRKQHVNDGHGGHGTYLAFLEKHYSTTAADYPQRALSKMAQGWVIAATQDGFTDTHTNPFDLSVDVTVKVASGYGKTVRKPMEETVWRILVRLNREDNYAFARELPNKRCWVKVTDPDTKRPEYIFWPAVPIIVDIILNSAARNSATRWVDSGEGDEFAVDLETLTNTPNLLPCSIRGRAEGFIRLHEIVEEKRSTVLGMYFSKDKINSSHSVPWIESGLVKSIVEMAALQRRYNPISGPVLARDPSAGKEYVSLEDVPYVFPLFRMPSRSKVYPPASGTVLSYWKDFLEYCEPIVERELGYKYPLVKNGQLVFDIHAIRVTIVTVLIESGVSPDIVQMLVGHRTILMTWYYKGIRASKLNESIGRAMRGTAPLDLDSVISEGDPSALERLAQRAARPDFVEDHVGIDMLRQHANTPSAPIDVFAHGICPGGDCSVGGARCVGGKYHPVWRPRACAGCRFRVTGPQFLPGIRFRLDCLMAEIKLSQRKSHELSELIEIQEEGGTPAPALRRAQTTEQSFRDELFKEWGLEHRWHELCRQVGAREPGAALGRNTLLVSEDAFDFSLLSSHLEEGHEFEQFHRLVREAIVVPASVLELPSGVRDKRDAYIREALRRNDKQDLVSRLAPRQQSMAFDLLGDLLLSAAPNPEVLEDVLTGVLKFVDVPSLADIEVELMENLSLVPPTSDRRADET